MSGAVTVSNKLKALADEINEAHALTTGAFKNALKHAVRAGELLIEAKKALGHGKWLPWLRENCTVKERTAQLYMKLARERPKLIGANPQAIAEFTITEAVAQITQQTARIARLPAPAIKQAFEEDDHLRLRTALRQAENLQRHQEYRRRREEEQRHQQAAPDTWAQAAILPPTPRWSEDEEHFLREVGRLCSDFMDAHPGADPQRVCDLLNVVYCAVQDGQVHAEWADPLPDDDDAPTSDDDRRSPYQDDVHVEQPEDDPFYIPPFLDRRNGSA